MTMLAEFCSDKVLEEAYDWCCKAREDYSANADIWYLRQNWQQLKPTLKSSLAAGEYCFSAMQRYDCSDGSERAIWSAQDAVVIKALSLVLTRHLTPKLSPSCTHLKGNGGVAQAVNFVRQEVKRHAFFICSDVLRFYASIEHNALMQQVRLLASDKIILKLIEQSIRRTEIYRGYYYQIRQGIPLGSALSPLLGGIMLMGLDSEMHKHNICYVRFIDDWLILCQTRMRLKSIIRKMYQVLNSLQLSVHPAKPQMGKLSNGLVFLGFSFNSNTTPTVADITLGKFYQNLQTLAQKSTNLKRLKSYISGFYSWCKGILRTKIYIFYFETTSTITRLSNLYNILPRLYSARTNFI